MTMLSLESYLRLSGRSMTTIRNYCSTISYFLDFCGKSTKEITISDIKDYIAHLMNNKLQASSINTKIRIVKIYLRDVLQIYSMADLMQIRTVKEPSHIVDSLSELEIKQLLNIMTDPVHRLIFMLCYGSGLRIGEAVSFKKKYLQTRILEGGKGAKDRYLILSDVFLKELDNYFSLMTEDDADSEYLFPSYSQSGHYSERSFQSSFSRYAKKVGIVRRVTPHILRKSFASNLARANESDFKIQALMGHSKITTTQRYTNIDKETLSRVKSPLSE